MTQLRKLKLPLWGLLFCAFFSFSSCEQSPAKPLAQMSSEELEAVIAKGGPNAVDAAFRLSNSYLRYGTGEQKLRAAAMMLTLAQNGDLTAKLRLCDEAYWMLAGDAAVNQCRDAAERKEGKAYAAFCRNNDDEADRENMCRLAAQSGEPDGYIPFAEALIGQGEQSQAYVWLMKTLDEGTPLQRDAAISMLLDIPDVEGNPFRPESRVKPQIPYQVLNTPAPRVSYYKKKGQCFVRYSVAPTGHPFAISVDCTHDEIEPEVRNTVHSWRFTPAHARGFPVFMMNESTVIVFNQE